LLTDHRRAFWYSLLLLGSLAFVLVGVGRHPPAIAPHTTIPFLGRIDQRVYDRMQSVRFSVLSGLFRSLNVVGGGLVTIPVRIAASLVLALRRQWRRFGAFVLTWAASELALTLLKTFFHRGRPPHPLVATVGFSFPSGHAVAGAATAVALVLAFFQPGPRRRKWEWIAVAFSFLMAFSRVYLNAHWFFDVVSGVLLGAGIALGAAALSTEIAHTYLRRHGVAAGDQPPADAG
jgi:undecaprenyl-diphosphatase